MNELKIGDVK